MKYDWEMHVSKDVLESLEFTALEVLPKNIRILAVAFYNTDDCEACLHYLTIPFDGIDLADLRGDVFGDAKAAYEAACLGILSIGA